MGIYFGNLLTILAISICFFDKLSQILRNLRIYLGEFIVAQTLVVKKNSLFPGLSFSRHGLVRSVVCSV